MTGLLAHTTILNSPDVDVAYQWTLVLLCWGVVLLALIFLVVRTMQRGRKLSEQVPEEQRRWM